LKGWLLWFYCRWWKNF